MYLYYLLSQLSKKLTNGCKYLNYLFPKKLTWLKHHDLNQGKVNNFYDGIYCNNENLEKLTMAVSSVILKSTI